jgi:hypothetical protein
MDRIHETSDTLSGATTIVDGTVVYNLSYPWTIDTSFYITITNTGGRLVTGSWLPQLYEKERPAPGVDFNYMIKHGTGASGVDQIKIATAISTLYAGWTLNFVYDRYYGSPNTVSLGSAFYSTAITIDGTADFGDDDTYVDFRPLGWSPIHLKIQPDAEVQVRINQDTNTDFIIGKGQSLDLDNFGQIGILEFANSNGNSAVINILASGKK